MTNKERDKNEAYTPKEYIDMIISVMGCINLDPASCAKANTVVRAAQYFTADDDGMSYPWSGNVWLNPPYNDAYGVMGWVSNFIDEYKYGRMAQGIILVNAGMETAYAQKLVQEGSAFAVPSRRISFLDENLEPMTSPRYANLFTYFGDSEGVFHFLREFREVGFVARTMT